MARSTLIALGLATLFLGGLIGGLVGGTLLSTKPPAAGPAAATPRDARSDTDPELVQAIEALAREVRLLRGASTSEPATKREPAEGSTHEPSSQEALIAALDRLTQALQAAHGRGVTGGIGITPLAVPPGGKNPAALERLVGRDWRENSREHRFWTYQQVLDRYGTPDEVSGEGAWIYYVDGGESTLQFQFVNGYVTNVYD